MLLVSFNLVHALVQSFCEDFQFSGCRSGLLQMLQPHFYSCYIASYSFVMGFMFADGQIFVEGFHEHSHDGNYQGPAGNDPI